MKAYKGFNKDMTCKGFPFEEGKSYHEDEADLRHSGFHACLDPIDCLAYYNPCDSVYHEVEIDNVSKQRRKDTKVVAKDIRVGSRIGIRDIVEASICFTRESVNDEGGADCASWDGSKQAASGDWSKQAASGDCSKQAASGYGSAQAAAGDCNKQAASGDSSAQAASGDWSAQAASGDCSTQAASGYGSTQAASGDWSAQAASGDGSKQAASGDCSKQETTGKNCVMMSAGNGGVAKGKIGSWIVLTEWQAKEGERIPTVVAKRIDGAEIKEDTWYTLKNGELMEIETILK